MTASSRGGRAAAAALLRSTPSPRSQQHTICIQCLLLPSRRPYAMAAIASKTVDQIHSSPPPNLKQTAPVSSPNIPYTTQAGIVLSRPPLLTAPQSSFEKSYFFYQKRLNERLVMPFTQYFYFKKDTPALTDYKIKAKERNGAPARELGGYRAYGEEAWNDELINSDATVGTEGVDKSMGKLGLAEPKWTMESLVRDAKVRAVEGKDGVAVEVHDEMEDAKELVVEKPQSRYTEADRKNDVKRLDRQLSRTLYLLVKRKGTNDWVFPAAELVGRESLYQAAERILVQAAGLNMNTWIVGHVPIGHYISPPVLKQAIPGSKTFFMKGRIMAGQADLSANLLGYEDYKWLTKEEMRKAVNARYWSGVKDMLADR